MRPVRIGLFAALVLALAAGCRSSPFPATVSGHVTYKGEPVKGGMIMFYSADGAPFRAALGTDGSYAMGDMPVGEFTVTVETESMNPDRKQATPGGARGAALMNERLAAERKGGFGPPSREEQLKRYTKIPKKYAKFETSDLKTTVAKGKQTRDFDLKD
jgi:hypothetical protein